MSPENKTSQPLQNNGFDFRRDFWRLSNQTSCSKQDELKKVAQGHVQLGFECLQGWRLCSLSGCVWGAQTWTQLWVFLSGDKWMGRIQQRALGFSPAFTYRAIPLPCLPDWSFLKSLYPSITSLLQTGISCAHHSMSFACWPNPLLSHLFIFILVTRNLIPHWFGPILLEKSLLPHVGRWILPLGSNPPFSGGVSWL